MVLQENKPSPIGMDCGFSYDTIEWESESFSAGFSYDRRPRGKEQGKLTQLNETDVRISRIEWPWTKGSSISPKHEI